MWGGDCHFVCVWTAVRLVLVPTCLRATTTCHNLPSTLVYICRSNRRQRRSFGEPSVLKCLSMAHFFSKIFRRSESTFCIRSSSNSHFLKMTQIRHPAGGHFLKKKCAIDRHLSTEGSPKLRLWRLFDPQIYTSVLVRLADLSAEAQTPQKMCKCFFLNPLLWSVSLFFQPFQQCARSVFQRVVQCISK